MGERRSASMVPTSVPEVTKQLSLDLSRKGNQRELRWSTQGNVTPSPIPINARTTASSQRLDVDYGVRISQTVHNTTPAISTLLGPIRALNKPAGN